MAHGTLEGTLILGAGGFLGPHLVRAALTAHRPRVVAVRRHAAPRPGPAEGVGDGAELRRRAVDLVEGHRLEDLLDEERPRAVVLSAALSRMGDCARDPAAARALNTDLPRRTAEWCARHGARLVHVSTDLVFDGSPPRPEGYREGDAPAPLHPYGETKAAGERAVRDAAPGALVVRLPLLFGDSGGQGLGASDSLLAALARGERPPLFADEWRTPLHVADAAAALLEAVEVGGTGILHVAGPVRLSRLALGRAVLAAHGMDASEEGPIVPSTRAAAGMAAMRPADVSLDAARARALLRTPLRAPVAALTRHAT